MRHGRPVHLYQFSSLLYLVTAMLVSSRAEATVMLFVLVKMADSAGKELISLERSVR